MRGMPGGRQEPSGSSLVLDALDVSEYVLVHETNGTSILRSGCAVPPKPPPFPDMSPMPGGIHEPLPLPRSGRPSARRGAGGTFFCANAIATRLPSKSCAAMGSTAPTNTKLMAAFVILVSPALGRKVYNTRGFR